MASGVVKDLGKLVSQQDHPEIQCHAAGTLRNLAAEEQSQVRKHCLCKMCYNIRSHSVKQ